MRNRNVFKLFDDAFGHRLKQSSDVKMFFNIFDDVSFCVKRRSQNGLAARSELVCKMLDRQKIIEKYL